MNQTPSFSGFQFQSIGQSQSDNEPELLKRMSAVNASGSYYDDQSSQSPYDDNNDAEMSESISVPATDSAGIPLEAFSAVPQRPSLIQALTSSVPSNSAGPKVDIFGQKIAFKLPTAAAPESPASASANGSDSSYNLTYPSTSAPQTPQNAPSSPIMKKESSRASVIPLTTNGIPSSSSIENNSAVSSATTNPLTVLKGMHSQFSSLTKQLFPSSESSPPSISAKFSSAKQLVQKSHDSVRTALTAAKDALEATVQATTLLQEVEEMVVTQEANQAKVVKEMEAVGEQLKEWISNRESNLHRRREREEKEKNEREAKEKETKERLAREAEEKERARIETHSTSSVTPAAATTTSDPTPDFLMGIYRAIQTHDPSGRVLKQLMEGTNKEIDPDEQKGQGSRVAEREQERPKKAEEEERRRLEEESRKKAEVDAETRRRLAVAAGEEQKRKAEVAEAQRKRKMLEERKKAKLDEELAAQANARAEEEARKRVLDEQQRREALQKQKLQATGSPNINTNVAKRLPVALVDSPVIPPIATISAGASSTSQSPTTPLSLPPPIWQPLPPKPQSAITTNVIAKQALVPPSEVQEQKLTKKQRAKARKLEQQQSARVGAVSGNVSLSLSTSAVVENDAQDQAALGVRLKKTNPHSPAGTNFALGMVLELNDRASTSSSVDAPLLHSSSSHSTGNLAINPKPGPSPTSPMAYASNVRFVTGAKQQVDQSTQDSVGNDGPKIKVEEEETRPLSLPTQSTPIAPVSPLVSIAPSTVQVARTVPSAAPSLTASVAESSSQLPQKKLPKRKLPDFTKDSLTSRSGAAAPPKQPSKDPTSATVAPPTTTAIATPPPQFRRTADSVASPAVPVAGGSPKQKLPPLTRQLPASKPMSASAPGAPASLKRPAQNPALTSISAPKNVPKTHKPPVSRVPVTNSNMAATQTVAPAPSSNASIPRALSPISPDMDGDRGWDNDMVRGRSRSRHDQYSTSPHIGYDRYSPSRHSHSPRIPSHSPSYFSRSPFSPIRSPSPVRTEFQYRSPSPGRYSPFSPSMRSLSPVGPPRRMKATRKRPPVDNDRELPPKKKLSNYQPGSNNNNNNNAYTPPPRSNAGASAPAYPQSYASSPYDQRSYSSPSYNDTPLGFRLSNGYSNPNETYSYSDHNNGSIYEERYQSQPRRRNSQHSTSPNQPDHHSGSEIALLARMGNSRQSNPNPNSKNARGRGQVNRGQGRGRGRGRGRGQPKDLSMRLHSNSRNDNPSGGLLNRLLQD